MLYKKKLPLFLFLLPGFIMMIIFLYIPFIQNIGLSFYDRHMPVLLPGQEPKYLGLDNFKYLFQDPKLRIALTNSLKMMVLVVVFQVGIAFILAILVSTIKKGQQFFRTVYFFPIVISAAALGLLFQLFYNYDGGMLNQLLANMGKEPVYWLSKELAFTMVSIPIIWSYVGFYFVIMLTGIADISDDVYEAAAIDGCTKFKQVFYITIPLLKGIIATCLTLSITGALKVFDLPWQIAFRGAPQGATHFMGTYMYDVTFFQLNYDYGSTIAILMVLLGVAVSLTIGRLLRPKD